MNTKTFSRAEAERMAPLLHSMTQEIQERARAVWKHEQALRALRAEGSPQWSDVGLLRSQITTESRGLKAVLDEARDLGLTVDDSQPPHIVVPCEGGDWIYSGTLDGTQFHRLEETTA